MLQRLRVLLLILGSLNITINLSTTDMVCVFFVDDFEVLRYLPEDERSFVVRSIYGNNLPS